MKKKLLVKLFLFVFALISPYLTQAQLIVTGQVRTRSEYRYGQGTLPEKGADPSVFTSQRTRLNVGFNSDRYKFYTSLQDVRVWGMDASTINNMDGNRLYLHEGWAEIILNDTVYFKKLSNLSFKIGRQEIAYDDQRLLGSLDWLQQGRRHDAAIIKLNKGTLQADLGFAYNQNREKKNVGSIYVGAPYPAQFSADSVAINAPAGTNGIGTMYKSMQYLYVAKEIGFTKISLLFFKDDFQKSGGTKNKFHRRNAVNSRLTMGGAVYTSIMRKHKLEGYAYYQGNEDKDGKTLDAWMFGGSAMFAVGRKFIIGPGWDYLSGNDLSKKSETNHRFDPLYGTPHKFWGYMDYFYVADPYGWGGNGALSPGLSNLYLKMKYRLRDNLMLNFDLHEFYAANTVANLSTPATDDVMNKRLGTEFDLVLQYALTKQVTVETGYSMIFGTNTLDKLKAPATDKRNIGNWGYIMISIRPDLMAPLMERLKTLTKQVEDLTQAK